MIRMAEGISRHEFGFNKAFGRHIQGLSMLITKGLEAFPAALNEESNPCPSVGKCKASYRVCNAESTSYPSSMFDLVTIMCEFKFIDLPCHHSPFDGALTHIDDFNTILRWFSRST